MRAWPRLGPLVLAPLLVLFSGCAGRSETPDAGPVIPTITLGAGTFAGPLLIEGDVIYQGQGPGQTRITAPADGAALEIPAGVQVTLRDLTLVGSPGQHTVVSSGTLVGERLEVTGGRAAFRIEEGTAELRWLNVHDAEAAVRLIAGRATVMDAVAERISTAAYFVAGGEFSGTRLQAQQVEYGLLTRPEARFTVENLEVRGATQAGVAVVGGGGTLRGMVLEGPMGAGGVLVNDLLAPLVIEDATITGVTGVGISLVRGEVSSRRVQITTVGFDSRGGLGMGLYLESATVHLEDLSVRQAAGAGIQLQGSTGTAAGLELQDNGAHGLEAWNLSTLEVSGASLLRNAGAGLLAWEGSRLTVSDGDLRANVLGPARVECASSAEVRLAAGVLAEEPLGACVVRY